MAPATTQLKGLITEPIPTVSLDRAKSELVLSFQAGEDDMLYLFFSNVKVDGIYKSTSKISLGPLQKGQRVIHRFQLTPWQLKAINKRPNPTLIFKREAKWKSGGGATGTLTLQIDK